MIQSPSAAISTPTSAGLRIAPMSTQNWKNVQNGDITFKIPPTATCNDDLLCSRITVPIEYEGRVMPPSVIWVDVTEYQGGSRREQYLASHPDIKECRPIYMDSVFGSVNALQIAVDGGWCQGGYLGGVAVVLGDSFVTIGPSLNYGDSNQEISRWDVRDTIISTLSSK